MIKTINIFYDEPQNDRWIKYDRYPRNLIRRLIRGKKRPGGVGMIVLNLMKGLDLLGVPYRLNDYRYARAHPEEIVCLIGMPFLLYTRSWKNPILFGAGIFSHPISCPDLLSRYPQVKKILVPGEWMRRMFEPFYQEKVMAWPVGIDTAKWSPDIKGATIIDFLLYDKVRWQHDRYEQDLLQPVRDLLDSRGFSYQVITYGQYQPEELAAALKTCKSALFFCEHETQGLAYQQILSTNTPILAWDRGGYWQDPAYFPDQVKYGPVSSVPYWDERCGITFTGMSDFELKLNLFVAGLPGFKPRDYIMENLTLEKCAEAYVHIYNEILRAQR
ncbi:glycosyltransferase [Mucilaginibacter sp.]|uniref:glycosyltransferase n=1 Tax=Mucilaginibacter sp. TaxID=1882438 RepID=UPI0035BBC05E